MTIDPRSLPEHSENVPETSWIEHMVALEDELGPLIPNGAHGNPARASRKLTAAERARRRVRFAAQVVELDDAA